MDRSTPLHPTPAGWLRDGSLARCEAPYRRWLDRRGYADRTTRVYTLCLAHFARWSSTQQLTPEELSATAIDRFVDEHLPHCDCPSPVQRHRAQVRAALAQLLPALGATGIAFVDVEPDAVVCELDRFDAYLRDRCGLAESTRKQRRAILVGLLRRPPTPSGLAAWRDPGQLRRFIAERLER